MAEALEGRLRDGLLELDLSLEESQVAQLMAYLRLIRKWNTVYNLTAVREPAEMLTHHLLDSLAAVMPLRRQLERQVAADLLDVGSGAGLPGIAIAICMPELRVDCVDAVAKKVAFIRQAVADLGLGNLAALHSRVQDLRHGYRVVACRAFASLADFVSWTEPVLAHGGVWMAMKGRMPTAEMAALPPRVEVFHVEQLKVPGLNAERCLIWMKRRAA